MSSHRTVVITDVEDAPRFQRCLAEVVKTVGPGVEVVGITARATRLPLQVARRVRLVRVAGDAGITDAVSREVAQDRLVVVARSSCRFSSGWLDAAEAVTTPMPWALSVLGSGHLVIAPRQVLSSRAAETCVDEVAGVRLPAASARATTPLGVPARLPRVSACLIVKDEAKVLAACLDALRDAVDEIVVYDTGSADRTIEIAEEHGAVVVRGYWDDHFGDARNRALEHCTGDWVLSVDADEVLTGDTASLRQFCGRLDGDLGRVRVVSTSWDGAEDGQHSQPLRLFRRGRCTWTGALHEFLVELPGERPLVLSDAVPPVRLLHSGYQYLTFVDKDKTTRNLEIARAAVDRLEASGEDATTAWDGYGRSLLTAGRHTEALEALAHVLERGDNSSAVIQAGRAALSCMPALGDWSRAQAWLAAMAHHGESRGNVALWEARAALAAGDLPVAERLLDEAADDRSCDRWGIPFNPVATLQVRAELAVHREDATGALDLLLESLRADPESVPLELLHRVHARTAGDVDDLVAVLPSAFLTRSVQEAVVLPTEHGDAWLTALHAASPEDRQVVVAATVVAARSSLERAVAWSGVARGMGLASFCPLRALALDERRPVAERCLAWALLVDVVGEPDAEDGLRRALASVPEEALPGVVSVLSDLTPGVTPIVEQVELRAALLAR